MFKYLRISAAGISKIYTGDVASADKHREIRRLTAYVAASTGFCVATGISRSLVIPAVIPQELAWSPASRAGMAVDLLVRASHYPKVRAWCWTILN